MSRCYPHELRAEFMGKMVKTKQHEAGFLGEMVKIRQLIAEFYW